LMTFSGKGDRVAVANWSVRRWCGWLSAKERK
jgi:hypothetical protein